MFVIHHGLDLWTGKPIPFNKWSFFLEVPWHLYSENVKELLNHLYFQFIPPLCVHLEDLGFYLMDTVMPFMRFFHKSLTTAAQIPLSFSKSSLKAKEMGNTQECTSRKQTLSSVPSNLESVTVWKPSSAVCLCACVNGMFVMVLTGL